MQSRQEIKSSFKLLMLATALTMILWFIPLASFITYPFSIFGTFIHETGHALAAFLTFGTVHDIAINGNGSGLTRTNGGWGLLISSAGYLSTTVFGAGLLLLLRSARYARPAAIGTACLLLLVTVLWGSNTGIWIAGLGFGLACLAIGLKANIRFVHFFMSFLGIQSLLNAFYDLRILMHLSALDPAVPSDAQNMAIATGGWVPAIVWAVGWTLISLAILAGTLLIYYRSLKQHSITTPLESVPLLTEVPPSAVNK
ncbi:MAG TPA: M50 family metallopeptidase [Blastocatellia bacterium]|nr:M50 family metallopeptidase [Blastocatellia bacterium]